MASPTLESPLSVRDHIRRTVQRAADEVWSLGELAATLGVSKQTAATYVTDMKFEITRSAVRRPRTVSDEAGVG